MGSVNQNLTPAIEPANGIEQVLKLDLSTYRTSISAFINFVIVVALIVAGFALRDDEILTAESGIGYAFGIIGGSMMLLLLIYPYRKKLKTARYLGSVRFWFKIHMFFGVAGPILILYHSNFSMGSLNSSVALYCMIIVASSGFIGRYFYTKIHYGLFGKKASLSGLLERIESEQGKLIIIYNITPELKSELAKFHSALKTTFSLLESINRFLVLGTKARIAGLILPFKLKRIVIAHAKQNQWAPLHTKHYLKMLNMHIHYYLQTTIKVCEFSIYERLFALWHMLHMPLFIMMIITGIIHVVAVHMY